MARLQDQLADWLARAEILARGAERRRVAAAEALEAGRPWDARQEALLILEELPRSRVALALWADAAESMLLDNEVAEALERLSGELPYRADVWLRLAGAQYRLGQDPEPALERAAEATEPVEAADRARLWRADLDLARGDAARAERWLDRSSLALRGSPQTVLRHVEAWLDQGEAERAERASAALPEPDTLDGRAWLVRGRLSAQAGDEAGAARAFERALVLEAVGAGRVVSAFVAGCSDASVVARLRAIVDELGWGAHPEWRAAFAIAQGRRDEALGALAEGARQPDAPAALVERYATLALDVRDADRLREAVGIAGSRRVPLAPGLPALCSALGAPARSVERLARLDAVGEGPWADELRREVYLGWLPDGEPADWDKLLDELSFLSRELGELGALREVELLARELERPLAVAVVGEFNAGKSSFINALLGEVVAPVGVLPTTATLNRLVWAPDRFVRVERRAGAGEDRILPHEELCAALSAIDPGSIDRVTIYAPLEQLRRIELIDTPGFNAPNAAHSATARAALAEAQVALWLLDATQPLKESERAVMAELVELGLPLVVLLNKLDRLQTPGAIDLALEHVREGLAQAGLVPEAPPVALSARLALAGREGDGPALERSGWDNVEELVERVLVGQSEALRERALRRRASGIASRLAQIAGDRAGSRRERERREAEQLRALREAAAGVQSERAAAEQRLGDAISAVLESLAPDLRAVSGNLEEPAARRFVALRTRAAAPALAEVAVGLLSAGEAAAGVEKELLPRVEVLLAALSPWLHGAADAEQTERVRRELGALLVEELVRVAEELGAGNPVRRVEPVEVRVRALAAALAEIARIRVR
jgi:GTP-binding protein EngB required for normal cell division